MDSRLSCMIWGIPKVDRKVRYDLLSGINGAATGLKIWTLRIKSRSFLSALCSPESFVNHFRSREVALFWKPARRLHPADPSKLRRTAAIPSISAGMGLMTRVNYVISVLET
jgi:hypothetical protein